MAKADSIAQKAILFEEQRIGKNFGWSLYNLAGIYAFLNQKKKVLEYLKAFENQKMAFRRYDYILIEPLFENLRDDPEFKAIVKRAQDEKASIRAQIREMEERGEIDL